MAVDRRLLVEFLQVYPFQPATAWWRAIEVGHLLAYPLPAGLGLDLGCGDGLLTQIVEAHASPAVRTWLGVDPDPAEAVLARQRQLYAEVLVCGADRIDRPDASFDFALSNSVLEHINPVEPVLREVARLLKSGAPFIFTVPSVRFRQCFRGPSWLRRRLLRQGRSQYLEQIDRRVAHLYYWDEPRWQRALSEAGFAGCRFSSYFTATEVHRWETVSNLTAGVLYELLGHRPPIQIQRSLGMRKSRTMPHWLARGMATVLSAGVRALNGGESGGLMVVANR
jgi:SAM-dependent methyltransferase